MLRVRLILFLGREERERKTYLVTWLCQDPNDSSLCSIDRTELRLGLKRWTGGHRPAKLWGKLPHGASREGGMAPVGKVAGAHCGGLEE